MIRLLLRFILVLVGTVAILFGMIMLLGGYFAFANEGVAFTIFIYLTLSVPVGGGYLCFRLSQSLYPRGTPHAKSDARLQKFGLLLSFVYIVLFTISLPTKGRIVLAILLLLIFARIHRPWSSKGAKTPFGFVSFANVFDFTIGGIVYLVTFAIMAAVTQGQVLGGLSLAGRGGKSGGGGASGRW